MVLVLYGELILATFFQVMVLVSIHCLSSWSLIINCTIKQWETIPNTGIQEIYFKVLHLICRPFCLEVKRLTHCGSVIHFSTIHIPLIKLSIDDSNRQAFMHNMNCIDFLFLSMINMIHYLFCIGISFTKIQSKVVFQNISVILLNMHPSEKKHN